MPSFPIIKNNNLKASSRKLPHWELNGSIYHITFVTWDRLELNETGRQVVLDACLFFNFKRYEVFAIVVMHDHVHLLIKPWEKVEMNGQDAFKDGQDAYPTVLSIGVKDK
jgi:putative transposase